MTVLDKPAARGQLLTILGVGFGVAVIVGNTIGAGILRTPGAIAQQLHTFWPYILVWVAGGLYALLGANALSELATLVPRSGGQYVFVRHGLGDYAGFVVGWSDWISTCGTTAAVAILIGNYAVPLLPEIRAQQVLALGMVASYTLLQWFGIRIGSLWQEFTSLLKGTVLLFFIAVCFLFGTRSPAAPTAMTLQPEGPMLLAFVIALQSVIYTYDGWTAVIYFSGEVKDHGRNIPRAMISSILTITAIYLLINLAFLRVVSLPTMAGNPFAVEAVVQHIFGKFGQGVLGVMIVFILLSALNSNVMMAPRVIHAMSVDGLFWRGAREVNRGGTPDVALLISSLLAAGFIVTNTFETVIAKLAFFFVANYTLSFITLFVLRRREPDAPRPYRAWAHPFTTGLALVASIAFLAAATASDVGNSLVSLGLLLLSIPVYLLIKRFRRD